jgi:hypothetical protein
MFLCVKSHANELLLKYIYPIAHAIRFKNDLTSKNYFSNGNFDRLSMTNYNFNVANFGPSGKKATSPHPPSNSLIPIPIEVPKVPN